MSIHTALVKTEEQKISIEKAKKFIDENYSKSNLDNLSNSAAFFSDRNEIVNDSYQLKNKELISIIPPIGGG